MGGLGQKRKALRLLRVRLTPQQRTLTGLVQKSILRPQENPLIEKAFQVQNIVAESALDFGLSGMDDTRTSPRDQKKNRGPGA